MIVASNKTLKSPSGSLNRFYEKELSFDSSYNDKCKDFDWAFCHVKDELESVQKYFDEKENYLYLSLPYKNEYPSVQTSIPIELYERIFKFINTFNPPFSESFSERYVQELFDDAQELLDYPNNWDEEGACGTDKTTLGNALDSFKKYYFFIYGKYGDVLTKPSVNILQDGSIYLFWETTKGKLLIIFKKGNSEIAYYYGEDKEKKIPFKGGVEIGKAQEYMAIWMKDYLKNE